MRNYLNSYDTNKSIKLKLESSYISDIKGEILFLIDSKKYSSDELKKLIFSIINQSYINYKVVILCEEEEQFIPYKSIDDRINIYYYSKIKEKSDFICSIRQVYKEYNSEYFFMLINKKKMSLKYIKETLNKLNSNIVAIYKNESLAIKKKYIKDFMQKYDISNINCYDELDKYNNVYIKGRK